LRLLLENCYLKNSRLTNGAQGEAFLTRSTDASSGIASLLFLFSAI
jgi:hypothetical protein